MAKTEKEDEAYAAALVRVMDSPDGRLFVRCLLKRVGMGLSSFRQPSPMVLPEERLVYNGALHDFGRHLEAEIVKYCPDKMDTMQLEERERILRAKVASKGKKESTEEETDA